MERVVINKEKLKTAIEKKKYSKEKLAQDIGRSKTYIYQILNGNVLDVRESDERFLCLLLGLNPGDLMEKDVDENLGASQAEIPKIFENILREIKETREEVRRVASVYEKMSEDIEALRRKVSANTVQLEKIKEDVNKSAKNENDRAREFLAEIIKDGRINGAEVLRMADEAGIDRGRLLKMKKEMGIQVETVGYGKNQKSYWYMPKG